MSFKNRHKPRKPINIDPEKMSERQKEKFYAQSCVEGIDQAEYHEGFVSGLVNSQSVDPIHNHWKDGEVSKSFDHGYTVGLTLGYEEYAEHV